MTNFNDFGLADGLLQALVKMQISVPTEIQGAALPPALKGEDVIGLAPTGSGKTLAYALAVMQFLNANPKARAVVLSPSRETAEQVDRVFTALTEGVPVTKVCATTGVPLKPQISALKKNPRLIVATPGRLVEHLRGNKLLLQGLSFLVIDEADRMLELGFGDQLKFIQSTLRGERQTLMFAATFNGKAEALAKTFLREGAARIKAEGTNAAVATLKQKVYFLLHAQKQNRLLDELKRMKGGVILFADSQESCVQLGRLLEHHKFSADFVHGDMNPGHRNRVLREFRENQFQILVTSDLLARGLDVAHVDHVINFELPYKADDFLHRIGRTARAGREGQALTFVTPADGRAYRRIKKFLEGAEEETLAREFQFDERD